MLVARASGSFFCLVCLFDLLNVFLFYIYRYLVFPPIMGETKTRFSEGELDELLDQLDFEELDLINKYVDPNVRDEIF